MLILYITYWQTCNEWPFIKIFPPLNDNGIRKIDSSYRWSNRYVKICCNKINIRFMNRCTFRTLWFLHSQKVWVQVLIYYEDSLKPIGFLLFLWLDGLFINITSFFYELPLSLGKWLTVRRIATHATHRWNNKKQLKKKPRQCKGVNEPSDTKIYRTPYSKTILFIP